MSSIWKVNEVDEELASKVNRFTVGEDYLLDRRLVPYDVQASKAHAEGLLTAGLLESSELRQLHAALDAVLEAWKEGTFTISVAQEDCHTAIEEFLIAEAGETGKKIHAGRSRNDQVLVAMRLYEKDALEELTKSALKLARTFIGKAETHSGLPMPGYTHSQKAMPSSVGMWLGAMAEMLLMDLETVKAAYALVDRCPLGTAAGYGVNFDLPRQSVSDALGFSAPVTVSLSAQNTRGTVDLKLLQALDAVAGTLAQFANDLLFYTSSENGFFRFDEAMYTGSSIMPQKKNLDPAELIRARSGNIGGSVQAVKMIIRNLHSGYHRDYQTVKKHVMESVDELKELLEMTSLLATNLQPQPDRLAEACTPELFAAHRVNKLVRQGLSFREAYREVKKAGLDNLSEDIDAAFRIGEARHLGATGNLGLQRLRDQADAFMLH